MILHFLVVDQRTFPITDIWRNISIYGTIISGPWAPGPVFNYSITCCRAFFEVTLVINAPGCCGIPPNYCISTFCVGNSGIDIAVPAYRSKFLHIVYTLVFKVGNSGIFFVFRFLFSLHLRNRLFMLLILKFLCILERVDLGRRVF